MLGHRAREEKREYASRRYTEQRDQQGERRNGGGFVSA